MKQALFIIDVQNEYFTGKMPVCYPQKSLDNILKAMDEAKKKNVPVLVIQHTSTQPNAKAFVYESDGWQIHPEVAKRPYDLLVEKHLPGSFTETSLESWLRKHEIDTVVIAGYMTHMCCDTTARQAMHLGYTVYFLSDGTGTLDIKNDAGFVTAEILHKTILTVQNSRFSKVISTEDWIKNLMENGING